jgi:Effector Associated Constant Component 1
MMTDNTALAEVELTADNPDDIDEVYDGLRGVPGITVAAAPKPTAPGEQGAALDVLTVALSSGTVTAFLQIIKVITESRGPKFSLKIRLGKNIVEVTSRNIDELLPVIRGLIEAYKASSSAGTAVSGAAESRKRSRWFPRRRAASARRPESSQGGQDC